MEGDFVLGGAFHFENEEEFKKLFNQFLASIIFHLLYRKPILRRSRIFSFDVDQTSYNVEFPPVIFRIKKRKGKEIAVLDETIELYVERNNNIFRFQYEAICKSINNTNEIELTKNIFSEISYRELNDGTQTIFTNDQAIQLCKKLSTSFVRVLLNNRLSNLNALHQIAMKCYLKYGGHLISFFLSLPNMQFGNKQSQYLLVKEEFDGSIPAFRLRFKNSNDFYFVSLYPLNKKTTDNTKIGTIFNKSKNQVEGHLTYKGYIESRISNESLRGSLFFDNFSKKNNILFCGVEEGYCINCNKELTDPISLKVGYGKTCASLIGIPYE